MFQPIIDRLYRMKIGTRTAISFFAVVMVVLMFTTASVLLLQYGKNIDKRIESSFNPVISAIKDYHILIGETGHLSADISIQPSEIKKIRLGKILERGYTRQKLRVIGLCQEPGLADIKKRIIGVDKQFEAVARMERSLMELMDTAGAYQDLNKLEKAKEIRVKIEEKISKLLYSLSETSLLAISVFNKLNTQKFASYRTLTYLLLIMIVVIILVSILSIYITNLTIIRPIKELSAILDEVGEGKIISFQSDINREDEIGTMIASAQKVVSGFKTKEQVANAIGKGEYNINVPLLSRKDRLGKALIEMRDNLLRSKIKEAENLKSMEAYTLKLEKKNKELDQFAYITSHDLKSPLRGINNLTEWIEEDMGDQLSEDSKGYFKMMRGRVHRLEALINSILKYSRAGRSIDDQEIIKSKDVVLEVLTQLNPKPECTVLFDETLPEVTGNKRDLKEVFLNFISNAIVHNNNPHPVVNITYTSKGNFYDFCIADNGPGIPKEFQQKIFTIFQTLERRDDVETVGAGLAIVKKIVEEYGGLTWVDSDEEQGSKFYFSWPKYAVIPEHEHPVISD